MNKRSLFLPLLLGMLLAACAQQDDAPTPATAPTADAGDEISAPQAEDRIDTEAETDAEAGTADDGDAGSADQAPETTAAAETASAPAPQAPQGPAPVLGTDFVEIANGQPYLPLNGQIEVVEVFGYTCPACAQFEPLISAWKRRQPADVRVTPVAAPFGGFWIPYAKAYFTAEAMDLVDSTHQAMFEAVHIQRSLPGQPTVATSDQLSAFYAQYGADAKRFASTMDSFAINGKLKRAEQFISRSGVSATPTLVVNGKYRVIGGESYDDVLRIVDHLVARERAAAQQ